MFTLADINTVTNSNDGGIFSDLHKDVFGYRPRGMVFESIQEFDNEYQYLIQRLNGKLEEDRIEKARNWEHFLYRLDGIKELVSNCDSVRACEIFADAEDIDAEERSFYGWESLEWKLGLEFGSIKRFLASEVQNDEFLKEFAYS